MITGFAQHTIIFPPELVTIFALADIGGGASPALLVHTASIAAAVRAKYRNYYNPLFIV